MRHFIKGLIGAVILVIIAWLGIWFYAEIRLKQLVAAQINALNNSSAEKVTYDRMISSRSPLVASVTLLRPTLSAQFSSELPSVTISAARIGAHVDLLHPLTLHVDIPLSITISTGGTAQILTFASADMTETLTPALWRGGTLNPISGGEADFADINLLASNGSLQVLHIDRLTSHETLNAQASNSQTALSLTGEMRNFRISPLLVRLFNIPFSGTLSRASTSLTLSGPLNWEQITRQSAALQTEAQSDHFLLQTTHDWAKAGGHAQGSLNLWLGPSHLQANLKLGFDQQVQPKGTLDVYADHIGQFANDVATSYPGLQGWISQIVMILAPYLSNTAQNGQVLTMHTLYGQTGVFTNGQQTGTLPYLNWTNLLNGAPLPAFAPGDGSGADSQ